MKSAISIIAAACLLVGAEAPAAAQDLAGTLKKVKETGIFTVGYRESSLPLSYLDDKLKPVGFSIELCKHVVDAAKAKLGMPDLNVKYNPVTSATRIPLMANGTVDLECGSTTNNAERQKQVAFTNTHFLTASRFVSTKSSNINSIDISMIMTFLRFRKMPKIPSVNRIAATAR